MLPREILYKIDVLRLLLGPFLDKSRAILATISSNCPSIYVFAKPADFKFPREKVLKLAEQ